MNQNSISWRAIEILKEERLCQIHTRDTHSFSPLDRGPITMKVTMENEPAVLRAADQGRADDFQSSILKGRASPLFANYEEADAYGKKFYKSAYYLKSE